MYSLYSYYATIDYSREKLIINYSAEPEGRSTDVYAYPYAGWEVGDSP